MAIADDHILALQHAMSDTMRSQLMGGIGHGLLGLTGKGGTPRHDQLVDAARLQYEAERQMAMMQMPMYDLVDLGAPLPKRRSKAKVDLSNEKVELTVLEYLEAKHDAFIRDVKL